MDVCKSCTSVWLADSRRLFIDRTKLPHKSFGQEQWGAVWSSDIQYNHINSTSVLQLNTSTHCRLRARSEHRSEGSCISSWTKKIDSAYWPKSVQYIFSTDVRALMYNIGPEMGHKRSQWQAIKKLWIKKWKMSTVFRLGNTQPTFLPVSGTPSR